MIDISVSASYIGDCRDLLKQLPEKCIQTCVTSPPYWGLRDYGVDGQLGLEATPEQYVANMVDVFREVRRVLRGDGTLWLNLGDCYVTNPRGPNGAASSTLTGTPDSERRKERWAASGGVGDPKFDVARQSHVRALAHQKNGTTDPKVKGRSHAVATSRGLATSTLKHKDLVGIPWMVAFALREDGWYLRSDIIWHKPNPMPESVTDRPTKSHEYVFLLSKSGSYFYDADAIAEPLASDPARWGRHTNKDPGMSAVRARPMFGDERGGRDGTEFGNGETRNKRSVWTVATQPYDGAHFATFPMALVEPCILAGSKPGDIVLDVFFGSGTTGQVAEKHGRKWIGFDLNPEYKKLQDQRTAQRSLVLGGTK